MTNRARSTVKALQVLGNSIRGLNWTQWRTVFNAVILPILTYAAPVWYTGQAGLTRSLRTAQNEAIRHMAGAFRTTPVDPLLQLMGVMPIDIHIKKLIKNASLRLYRLPLNSQLLARVPGPWGPPRAGLLPLPVLPPRRAYISNLRSLAANLPNGPRIDLLAAPPWQLDFSSPRLSSNHRVRHGDEKKLWINTIKSNTSRPNHLTVFARGSKSNWHREDDLQPAIGVASLWVNDQEVASATRHIGVTATVFDADLAALASAILQAQLYLNTHPGTQVTIFSTNPAAIQAITNLRPHQGQPFSRDFCSTLTQIFSLSRSSVKLEWCPSEVSIAGIKRCIDLARSHATTPFPPFHREPHTVSHQQATSHEIAIETWQGRSWHNADRRGQTFRALPEPPTGKLPPVIRAAAEAPRKVASTLVRMITGHAFIGSYYSRFHPRKPTHCPDCGFNPQSVEHIIQSCPRYAHAQATHLLPVSQDLSLAILFGTTKGGKALVRFLEEMKACFTPVEQPFDPG